MPTPETCPACQHALLEGDGFCPSCGTPIGERSEASGERRRQQASAATDRVSCSSCHSPMLAGDVYCASCGARTGDEQPAPQASPGGHIPQQLIDGFKGKYELIRELGRGGMGYVYLARDLELDRLDAIKVLKPSMLSEDEMVERFRAEARAIAKLHHPSIVSVYNVGNAEGLYYFVMDYIAGVSLRQILKQVGPLPIPVVEGILYQTGSALSYAHQTLVHRDVKPANIMLTQRGNVVVTDFGIAKVTESQAGLTRTGMLMGTPEYMSPEQCRETSVTPHSDQYALGAVAYAMLTGSPPYTGQWLQVASAHQVKPVPSVRERRPDCPEKLALAVERMLAKHPSERWPDIFDVLRHLELRPLAMDDPAIIETSSLVRRTMSATNAGGATPAASRTPTDLRILAAPDELELGDKVSLHASMVFDDGVERHGDGLVWESTDPSIARVTSDTGELEATGLGSVLITARHGTVSGTISLGVIPQRVVELTVRPDRVDLAPKQSIQLSAEARDKNGTLLDRAVNWSSSDPRLLRVSKDGRVTTQSAGRATVFAHCDGAGSICQVTVTGAGETTKPVTAASPSSNDETVAVQHESAAVPTPVPAARPPGPEATPSRAAPERSAPKARPAGTTAAPAWRNRAIAASIILLVLAGLGTALLPDGPAPVQSIRIARAGTGESVPGAIELPLGETVRLTATGLDPEGAALDREVSWESDDPSVVSVSENGTILAAAGGSTVVRAVIDEIVQPVAVEVSIRIASIQITDPDGDAVESLSLGEDDLIRLEATVLGEDGGVLSRPVRWRSSDPTVATIDGGRLLAIAGGSTTIEVLADGVTHSLAVTVASSSVPVNPPPPPVRTTVTVDILIVGPEDAVLYINDVRVGTGERLYTVELLRGRNVVRAEHPSFRPFVDSIDPATLDIPSGAARPRAVVRMQR